MAGEIKIPGITSGWTVYAIVRSAVGTVWQTTTSTLVAYVTANRANYDIALTEQGTTSGVYVGDFPAAAAGVYDIEAYRQTGGAPAEPTTDTYLGMEKGFEWDGSANVSLYSRLAPTTAGRTLDVSAGGEAGVDWANVGTPGSTVDLSATTVNLANTVTTLTNLPAITANWLTAAGTASDFGTEIGVAVWAETTRVLTAATNIVFPIADQVWGESLSGGAFGGAGTIGAMVVLNLDDTVSGVDDRVWTVAARTLTSLAGLTVDTVTTLTNLPAITANWLTAAGTAADFGTEIGTAVWASTTRALTSTGIDAITVETGLNARQALSIIASSAAGVLAGATTTSITISAAGVSATNRITATVDSDGNRSAVTLAAPA